MIHLGTNGWLFLTGGTNTVLQYYTSSEHFSDEQCDLWCELIERRARRAADLGISDYFHVIAPDKLSVYPEFFRGDLPFAWRAPSRLLPARMSTPALLDVLPDLMRAKQRGRLLYWKTDSHWSFDGVFVVYSAICERLGIKPMVEIKDYPSIDRVMALDLGSKLDPPVTELHSVRTCCKNARRTYYNEIVHYNQQLTVMHQGAYVIFKNARPRDPRTVFLVGDSFAEFRPSLLTGLLAETFASVHFVWHSNVDWNLVGRIMPDILITEIAERFMNVIPDDELNLEELVAHRIAAAKVS